MLLDYTLLYFTISYYCTLSLQVRFHSNITSVILSFLSRILDLGLRDLGAQGFGISKSKLRV